MVKQEVAERVGIWIFGEGKGKSKAHTVTRKKRGEDKLSKHHPIKQLLSQGYIFISNEIVKLKHAWDHVAENLSVL